MYQKYNAHKVKAGDMVFDSKKEYRRYLELKAMEEAEQISELKRQVKYVLIPAQREPDTVGKRGGKIKGKLLERECSYIADFVYKDSQGQTIVEDVKGYHGGGAYEIFKIKRKLMLYLKNIEVKEV